MLDFWTYALGQTWLVKCLKSLVPEVPSTSNMVNAPKQFSKLNDSNFTIFIYPCEYICRLKSFSE